MRDGRATGAKLAVDGVSMRFASDPVLTVERLQISPGMFVALTGPSGSGKTTLLHLIAGIARPTTGTIAWDGVDISRMKQSAVDAWRRDNCGLVFQDFHLIEQLTPLQNVVLPATFSNFITPPTERARAADLLKQLGVPPDARAVTTLSRGECQRVAIARALLSDPKILLADEPTASLDEPAARGVADTLVALAAEGRTVIAVTHDHVLIERATRVLRLEHGLIVSDVMAEQSAATAGAAS